MFWIKVLIPVFFVFTSVQGSTSLMDLYTNSWKKSYAPISENYIYEIKALFTEIFSNPEQWETHSKSFNKLGFNIQSINLHNKPLLLITEINGSGNGFYLVKIQKDKNPQLWQAPHSRSDKLTGKILLKLFTEHPIHAVAFNSVHRKIADVAHFQNSVFQIFTSSFHNVFPQSEIIQLHGFSKTKRNTQKGKLADIIISDTTKNPSEAVFSIYSRLNKLPETTTELFEHSIRELGGTTNAQGIALRKTGFEKFIHIELSFPIRERLNKSSDFRNSLYKAIRGTHER